jgi:hypothetical protein
MHDLPHSKETIQKYGLLPEMMQKQCHGTDYALISSVHTILKAT